MTANPLSLEESIERFGDALSRSDVEAATPFVAESFAIVSLDGELLTRDRAWWESMVAAFRLTSFELEQEFVLRREGAAVHYRHARMTSTIGSAERTGVFCLADHWVHDEERGWYLWHRLSVPVVDSLRLPETF